MTFQKNFPITPFALKSYIKYTRDITGAHRNVPPYYFTGEIDAMRQFINTKNNKIITN